MSPIDRALWFLTAAFSVIALSRIVTLNVWRTQPLGAFAFMLFASISRDLLLWRVPYNTRAYAVAWEAFLPLLLVSHAWCAFAAYRAVVSLYPKIGRFAVWLFSAALIVAALACLGTLPFELQRIGQSNESFIRSMFLAHRWVDGLSAGGLILACGFLACFPRPMKRMPANLIRHAVLLACYFSAYTLVAFVENLMPMGGAAWLERTQFAFIALLYAGWTLGLSKQGEHSIAWETLTPDVQDFIRERHEFAVALARHAAK
jgi:hypothetical protein